MWPTLLMNSSDLCWTKPPPLPPRRLTWEFAFDLPKWYHAWRVCNINSNRRSKMNMSWTWRKQSKAYATNVIANVNSRVRQTQMKHDELKQPRVVGNVVANVTNRKFEKSANEHELNMWWISWGGNVSSWSKVSWRSEFCRRLILCYAMLRSPCVPTISSHSLLTYMPLTSFET